MQNFIALDELNNIIDAYILLVYNIIMAADIYIISISGQNFKKEVSLFNEYLCIPITKPITSSVS